MLGVRGMTALAAVAATLLVAAAPAGASSLVYVKDGNVWVAAPDGSHQTQVTRDGSPGDPYSSPTQADDGTIVAVRGKGDGSKLYRMAQDGRLLNQPFGVASPLGTISGASVSPDGSTVAYWYVSAVAPGYGYGLQTEAATAYTAADHFAPPPGSGQQREFREPSWLSNGRTLLMDNNLVGFDDVGGGDDSTTSWFSSYDFDPNANDSRDFHHGVVTRQGDKLAVAERSAEPGVPDHLALFTVPAGAPPAKPVPACTRDASGQLGALSWSPDGTQLAYSEPDGIHVDTIPGLADCTKLTTAGLVIPGASDPSWGPADVGAGPGPGPGPAPGPARGGAKLSVPHQRLGAVLASGLRATARCSARCRVAAVAVVERATAKRYHLPLGKGGSVAVGKGVGSRGGAGTVKLRIRLTATARKRLRRARSVRFGVAAVVQTKSGIQPATKIVTVRR